MKCILNFDDKICAWLIEKIVARAGGGSLNKALQIMVIEWSTLEDARNRPETDQKPTRIQEDDQSSDDKLSAALTSIDNEW